MPKPQRLDVFFERLGAAPAASSRDEALALVATTLNATEDELTDIPYDPDAWQNDGRM